MVWEEIAERPQRAEADIPRQVVIPHGGTPPAASHPWKQRYDGMPDQSLAKHQIRGSKLCWRLPALRPKRSAYGLAGLRFGSRQHNRKRTSKRDISNELRQGTFWTRLDKTAFRSTWKPAKTCILFKVMRRLRK